MGFSTMMNVAATGMAAQGARLTAVSSNLANADSIVNSSGTPYRAREVVLAAAPAHGGGGPAQQGMAGVRVLGIVASSKAPREVYDPGSSFANAKGYVKESNVSPVDAMVNMITASKAYKADLQTFDLGKTLALKTLTV